MSDLETRISQWFDSISEMTPENVEARRDVELVITKLDDGQVRVADGGPTGAVVVHEWVRKAILLLFRLRGLEKSRSVLRIPGPIGVEARLRTARCSRVPEPRRAGELPQPRGHLDAELRQHRRVGRGEHDGRHVGDRGQLRPDRGNVHLSGGVGIGGVLEPANALPVVIEDDAFIGIAAWSRKARASGEDPYSVSARHSTFDPSD